jgi:chlorite dismutase
MHERLYEFSAAKTGAWRVVSMASVIGESLPGASALDIQPASIDAAKSGATWSLRGIRSNERYVEAAERADLAKVQAELGRSDATSACLIPIRKSQAWWALAQDERRAIMEEKSHHIAIGARYLPAVARRLYHSRDLLEPFDFLTWFEFAPEHTSAFDDLLARMRDTLEWRYVDREVEIRVEQAG